VLVAYTLGIFHPEWSMNKDGPPGFFELLLFYIILISMLLIYFCILWGAAVTAFSISSERFVVRTVSGRQSINIAEIEQIVWRIPPQLWDSSKTEKRARYLKLFMVELSGQGRLVGVRLNLFSPKAQEDIIQTIRNLFRDRPQAGWNEFVLAREQIRLLGEQQKLREKQPVPNSEAKLLIMAFVALIWSTLAWVACMPWFHGVPVGGLYGFSHSIQVLLTSGAMFGAPSMLLLNLWEVFRYQATKRTLLALAFSIAGTVLSAVAIRQMVVDIVARITHY
jgi:hypothetical protein